MVSGFAKYYVDHTLGLWSRAADGVPFSATFFQSKGDPIRYLREREIVHFQRFGESLRIVQDNIPRTSMPSIRHFWRIRRDRGFAIRDGIRQRGGGGRKVRLLYNYNTSAIYFKFF